MSFAPANNDDPGFAPNGRNRRILEWLTRLSQPGLSFQALGQPFDLRERIAVQPSNEAPLPDDWQTIASLCGYGCKDFAEAGALLPLTAAEADYFRRNHRGTESLVSRDFLNARSDLPSPLAELYGLYLHRARADAEAALFVAQATGSIRVARIMADLFCIGGFANGLECIGYLGSIYSVPAGFDTSDIIDRANHEALRRLALPADDADHLLKLAPDEIGVLAAAIAEERVLSPADFIDKANLLAEARQDVTRMPASQHFASAIMERDLPPQAPWVMRLRAAYGRVLEPWVAGLPDTGMGAVRKLH